MIITATYDPADDKIRLSASSRLDAETYARVKAAGYGWAPKQEVFYAVWSPRREDLAIELAGEIGDEDTTLVERAEIRAERFEDYSDKRLTDAHRAKETVSRISDGIPFGQPILIGHHSEKHARKDAERIENGMRKAVKMWETASYWQSRAAGAIAHAKYKELPAVRARRIKTIEAEIRSLVADYTPHPGNRIMQSRSYYNGFRYQCAACERFQIGYRHEMTCECGGKEWNEAPEVVAHVWTGPKGRGGRWVAEDRLEKIEAGNARSLEHLRNRLEYERAMLAEGGGLIADKFAFAVGGRVQRDRGDWFVVTAVNKRDGAVFSVSVAGHFASTIPVEEIKDYHEPAEGDAEKVKAAIKAPPLVNFRAEGCKEMTMAEWKRATSWSGSAFVANFDAEGHHTFGRVRDGEKPIAYRQRSTIKGGGNYDRTPVFITDAAVKEPPRAAAVKPTGVLRGMLAELPREERRAYVAPEPTEFDALKDALRSGVAVQVVSAPQLFPTPAALAARMVALSGLQAGETVLEPSAGNGAIVRAVIEAVDTEIVGYEVNRDLVSHLTRTFPSYKLQARCCDFLTVTEGQGQFPIVLMNPPFANADDIKHIQHARTFLKPGGTLVAICANGPRQRAALMDIAEHWEDLPAGTFTESGTNVNAALLVVRA